MPKKLFPVAISENGQCEIPAPLRKKLQLSSGESLVFWINERGHLEAEPAHEARSRSYKQFNTEADIIAESLANSWPHLNAEDFIAQQRRCRYLD